MTTYRCTSSAKVDVYQKANAYTIASSDARAGLPDIALVSCQCSNALSQGGTFSFTCKTRDPLTYIQALRDDDWVDISFGKNGIYWHTMRGIISDVRMTQEAGDGAATTTIVVSGNSFQRAWETTTSYFFEALQENLLFDAISKISGGMTFLRKAPEGNVEAILFDLFNYVGQLPLGSRANFALPATIPGLGPTLADAAVYDTSMVDDARQSAVSQDKSAFAQNSIFGGQSLWQLATLFSDNMFCELYTDILPSGGLKALAKDPNMTGGLDTESSRMAVVQRDKPFILVSNDTLRPTRDAGSFYLLPLVSINQDELRGMSLGKTGMERFNCFNVAPPSNADSAVGGLVSLRYPIWSAADMEAHGLRRLDGQTLYLAEAPQNTAALRNAQKSQLCDFYCMNADMFSGVLSFGNPHPELRVGTRLQVQRQSNLVFEVYVEGVANSWSVNRLSTQVQFTRGFFGGTDKFTQQLASKRSEFERADITSTATSGEDLAVT